MTTALEAIKAKLETLTAEFAALVARTARSILIPEKKISLAEGESLGGLVLDDVGHPSHYVIMLPGEVESTSWDDSMAWAKTAGGRLPTRREQSLLYAHCKAEFKAAYYWSSEQHADHSGNAWLQYFDDGYQIYNHKTFQGRARAVRSEPIQ
ncbi:MAG: DUF1566 domain-containing protein [Pseudomonadota bacterium]